MRPAPARAASLVLVGLLFLGLTGCLGRRTARPVALEWWITFAPDSPEYPTFRAIADAYTARTGYEVDLVSVPWEDIAPRGDTPTRLSIALGSGKGPDLWGPVPHNWTAAFAVGGQALALGAGQIEQEGQYLSLAMEACQYDGKQYALPVLADAVALLYNKSSVSAPPKTFDELLTLAKSLTKPKEDRWGFVMPLLSPFHVYPFIDGYGGYIFACGTTGCELGNIGLGNEGAVKGVQLLSKLYVKDKLFPEPLIDRALTYSYAARLFSEGKAAMIVDGSWSLPTVRASGISYGVAPIPALPGTAERPRPLTTIQAVVVSARSGHTAEAVGLANHIASPESVLAVGEVWSKLPVREDALQSPQFRTDAYWSVWRAQLLGSRPLPNAPELGYVWQPWTQALEEAIPGLTPTQEALDRAVQQIREVLKGD